MTSSILAEISDFGDKKYFFPPIHKDNNMSTESKELQTTKENNIAPSEKSQMDIALEQMNQVAQVVVENIKDDRDKNDELYDFMKDEIDINNDKNPATREAMSKAMELKMKGTDQMIELLKVKAKLINPSKGVNVNVNLGSYNDSKGGNTNEMIDIVENIDFEVGDED